MRSTSNRLVRAAAAAPTFLVALSALAQGADDCLSAQPLKGYGTYAFDTSAATTDGLSDGLCDFFGNQQIFNDVWFCYTASFGSGTITVAPFAFLGDFTDPATGVRYVATPGTTWTASEALAQSLGGHLVSIGDQAEQDFVFANFGQLGGVDRRIWIGFTDRKSEGLWAWSDGSPAKYTNWNGGEPNNAGAVEHYAEMLGSSGRWNDLNDAGAGFPHLAVIELGEGGGGGEPQCPADLDLDGNVGASDLATMLGAWGSSAAYADINADGNVNAQDVAILLGAWGPCP